MSHHFIFKDPKIPLEDRSHHNNGSKDLNIMVVGSKGVGKTAITVRYLTHRFIGDYDSEKEALYTHSTCVDGKPVTLHILDTTWQDQPLDTKENHIEWADGLMLVYSITDGESFDKLREIADFALGRRGDKIFMALVANKCDLLHRKRVSDTRAAQFCAEYNCLFFETSASDNFSDIDIAFSSLCRQIKTVHKKREKLSKFLQNPAVSAKLQIRNSLRNFAEKKWRSRTSTM